MTLKTNKKTDEHFSQESVDIAHMLITANELYQSTLDPLLNTNEREKTLSIAKIFVENTLKIEPENESALNLSGRIELDFGRVSEARKLLEKAIKINSENSQFFINLGYVCLAEKKYDEAESNFLKALYLEKNASQAFSGIALARLKTGDYLGSFQRYQSLISKGYNNAFIKQNTLEALEHLQADFYQNNLEEDIISYYQWENADHSKLANMAASLLVHKYQLLDETAVINMDDLLSDVLLHSLLLKGGLHQPMLETLITSLRKHILFEAAETHRLRDALLPVAMALAIYGADTDYALYTEEDESHQVVCLKNKILTCTKDHNWNQNDIVGACIVFCMYEPLYGQPFTFKLMKHEVDEWPVATQSLFQKALYDLADEHLHRFNTFGDNVQHIINIESKRAWPRWKDTTFHNKTNYIKALENEIGYYPVLKLLQGKKLDILVYGCESGLRAITMALFFDNISILAIDDDCENILYAQRKAAELGVENIHFDHIDSLNHKNLLQKFDIIECSDKINYVEDVETTLESLLTHLSEDALIRISFRSEKNGGAIKQIRELISSRNLAATEDNIRHLRHALISESDNEFWGEIINKQEFYSIGGCRKILFGKWESTFNLISISELAARLKLHCLGFVDLNASNLNKVNQNQIATHMDIKALDEHYFGESYEIYLTKSK